MFLPPPQTAPFLSDPESLDLFTTLVPDGYNDPYYQACFVLARDYAYRTGVEQVHMFAHGVAVGMTVARHPRFQSATVA